MTKPLTINVDMDGVVYDFPQAFINMIANRTGKLHSYPETWDWWWEWGMSEGEWKAWFRSGIETGELWRQGPMVADARRWLWALSDAGHYIRIVTHRAYIAGLYETAVLSTSAWLKENNVPFRALCFEGRKRDIKADVVIDDKPDMLWTLPDALNILFATPYNATPAPTARGTTVVRARNWAQVKQLIGELE